MKKIFLSLGLIAGLTLTSCSDFLDKEPTNALPVDGSITSAKDLQYAINGVAYPLTVERMSYASEFGIYADLLTNNYKIVKDNGQSTSITYYTITKSDVFSETPYYYFYKSIAEANKALSEAEKLEQTDEIKNLEGQLYAWRGLLHFDIARMFAHIPSTVDATAANSGIVLATRVFEPEYIGNRNTLKETYDQIISDLTKAAEMMEEESETGYFNKYAAIALRSRAYLYVGEYQKAIDDANTVINSKKYSLYTIDNYTKVWDKEGTEESIFELLITSNYTPQRNAIGYFCDYSGYSEMAFNEEGDLYKYLSTHPKDVRSKTIKDQTGAKDNKAYYPGKFPGREGNLYVNNPKIIRLSELYLIAAEAYSNLGDAAKAAEYINTLRKNRIEGYKDVASVTIDDILNEYTYELYQENQIAFAYWRNKKSVTNVYGKEVKYDDERTILPIPQREIDLNANLKQNAGY
jgi:hypothetical protein